MSLRAWLCENPALRYQLGAGDKADVLAWGPVRDALALQRPDGSWGDDGKRTGAMATVAALLALARCGLDATEPPVARALAFLRGRHVHDGALSTNTGGSGVLPCYVGQFAALVATAAPGDPLLRSGVDWLDTWQRYDHRDLRGGGGGEAWGFRSPHNYGCWKTVSCYHGVVGGLRALAAVPVERRTALDRERLGACLAWLERHRAVRRSGDDRLLFRHLHQFFLFGGYRAHAIDVLEALSRADPALGRQPWVQAEVAAVDALCPEGRVPLVKDYPMHVPGLAPLEPVGAPSRFLSFQWWRTKARLGLGPAAS